MRDDVYFLEKIEKYKQERKYIFEPLKITFELSSPICLTHPWIHFDSIISHLHLKKILGDDYFLLPSKFPISRLLKGRDDLSILPIKKFKDLYFASVSIFNNETKKVTKIYKRFEDRYDINTKRRRITKGGGFFKDYAISTLYLTADKVVFYANGDFEEINNLLKDLNGLGNDTRIGWGHIKSYKVEKIDEDWSLVYEGKAMRPIPVEYLKKYTETAYLAWKSPYWANESVGLCAIPGSEVELGEDLERYIQNTF